MGASRDHKSRPAPDLRLAQAKRQEMKQLGSGDLKSRHGTDTRGWRLDELDGAANDPTPVHVP